VKAPPNPPSQLSHLISDVGLELEGILIGMLLLQYCVGFCSCAIFCSLLYLQNGFVTTEPFHYDQRQLPACLFIVRWWRGPDRIEA